MHSSSRPYHLFILTLIGLAIASLTTISQATAQTPNAQLDPQSVRSADIVVSGVVADDPQIDIGESYPPVYWYRFTVRDTKQVKNTLPDDLQILYTVRGEDHTPIKKGDHLLLALRKLDQHLEDEGSKTAQKPKVRSTLDVIGKVPLTPAALSAARRAVEDLKPLGSGVAMTIEQLPPKKPVKWSNPYGDGRFRVVITNSGKQPAHVPAVFAYSPYGSKQVRPAAVMAPGASQTFEVDALELPWKNLPGGARLTITVQAADKSVSSFFYFSYNHHMPMLRAKQPDHPIR